MLLLAQHLDTSDELLMSDEERKAFLAPIPVPYSWTSAHPLGRSGYRGVSAVRTGGNFYAVVKSRGTRHYLGVFPTAKEAAHAYDAKAKELHGSWAMLNFPEAA